MLQQSSEAYAEHRWSNVAFGVYASMNFAFMVAVGSKGDLQCVATGVIAASCSMFLILLYASKVLLNPVNPPVNYHKQVLTHAYEFGCYATLIYLCCFFYALREEPRHIALILASATVYCTIAAACCYVWTGVAWSMYERETRKKAE